VKRETSVSSRSIEAQRELAAAAGVPFSTHDAEHDDIIVAIEGCSDGIKDKVLSVSESIIDLEEKIDRLSKSLHNIQYTVAAILICLLFVAFRLR
jgi:hypothetical protein